MKNLLLTSTMTAALALPMLTLPAVAQDAPAGLFRTAPDATELRASEFIGKRIYASEAALESDEYEGLQEGWNDIGEINDVILSRDGTIEAVLVDIGGFLGMGERQVAVDMQSIRFVADSATPEDLSDYFLVMNADRATLEGAPAYGADAMDGAAATDPAATPAADATAEPATATAPAADAGATRDPVSREGFAVAGAEQLTAEKLKGAKVYDANDEWIGEIGELVLTADGQVTDAVVDVGGFLGIGENPVALKMGEVDVLHAETSGEIRVYVSQTKEQLEAMPKFEG